MSGAQCKVIAPRQGFINSESGELVKVDESFLVTASVLYDAVFIVDHPNPAFLINSKDALFFVAEAFKHCKAIGADANSGPFLEAALPAAALQSAGIITDSGTAGFMEAVSQHRFWDREEDLVVVA